MLSYARVIKWKLTGIWVVRSKYWEYCGSGGSEHCSEEKVRCPSFIVVHWGSGSKTILCWLCNKWTHKKYSGTKMEYCKNVNFAA